MSLERKERKLFLKDGTIIMNMMNIAEKRRESGIGRLELEQLVDRTIKESGALDASKILIIPPDITRFHSRAGLITDLLVEQLGSRVAAVLPAIGTHAPMTENEIAQMYPLCPRTLFRVHDWRKDVVELGTIPEERVAEISGGKVRYYYPIQTNKILAFGDIDLVFSIGQVVPHEVAGMANHAKNIFVGTGGKEAIDKSHYLGATCGMESIMGRIDTPVRNLFDDALDLSKTRLPAIVWILTVIGTAGDGSLMQQGYFAGYDRKCFEEACALSAEINIALFDKPLRKAVVWLDPSEYRSTWLGNKSIYRLRMAMADDSELIILAPGLRSFGEDAQIDAVIRSFGYRPSAEIQGLVAHEPALSQNLSAAAHLIHGSSEGRFTISYAPGPAMTREEIESVGYRYMDLEKAKSRYLPEGRLAGAGLYSTVDGEEYFFVPNPALGLWSTAERMAGVKKP
jgi:nickel-dependent lactate racemase